MQTFDALSRLSVSFHLFSFLYSHNEASVQQLPLKNPIVVTSFSPPPPAHLPKALKLLLTFPIPPFCYHKSQPLFSYSLLILVCQSARIYGINHWLVHHSALWQTAAAPWLLPFTEQLLFSKTGHFISFALYFSASFRAEKTGTWLVNLCIE